MVRTFFFKNFVSCWTLFKMNNNRRHFTKTTSVFFLDFDEQTVVVRMLKDEWKYELRHSCWPVPRGISFVKAEKFGSNFSFSPTFSEVVAQWTCRNYFGPKRVNEISWIFLRDNRIINPNAFKEIFPWCSTFLTFYLKTKFCSVLL